MEKQDNNEEIQDKSVSESLKDKKQIFKSKENIAIIVLTALLIISIFGNFSSLTESKDETQIASLEEQVKTLNEQITKQDETIKNDKEQIKTLQDEKQKVEQEKASLEEEKKNLESQKSTLEQEKQNLTNEVESLKSRISKTNTSSSKNTSSPKSISAQDTNSAIVYVTKTGTKYHNSGCSYLNRSKIEMTLSEAKNRGYTPCSRCH